jgi:membrane protein implicated in regulation of membrane protease activity
VIYGRRPRQLLIVWGTLLALAGLLYWFELQAPAFHYLLRPFYWIILAVALFMSWRWFRARSRKDRRAGDRRRSDRREQKDSLSADSGGSPANDQ